MILQGNGQNDPPLCSQTFSEQCGSYSQAPLFYLVAQEHYGKQDYLLLEEIHPSYNNEEHSQENGYVIPVNKKRQEKQGKEINLRDHFYAFGHKVS